MQRKCYFILIVILVLFAGCNYYEGPRKLGFQIVVGQLDNGTISVKNEAEAGEEITLIASSPNDYFYLYAVLVRDGISNDVIPVSGTGNKRTFIMPANPVKITASFELNAGVYTIKMPSQYANGDIFSINGDRYDAGYGRQGDTITLLFLPEKGYKLSSVYITGQTTGNAIPPGAGGYTIDNVNKKLTFIMLDEDVFLNQTDAGGGPIFTPINGN